VARYAWGRDYHKVLLAKLRRATEALTTHWPGHRWRSFTDTAPLDERYWAERAGASFTARNTLSIRRGEGSWFLLGEILTTQTFEPTAAGDHRHGSCPSGCRRCTTVCPTGALSSDGKIDARRCLSYLTIEHRGPIDDEWKPKLGPWLFGCDLCQEVCPFNLGAKETPEPEFRAWKAGPDLDPADLLGLDDPGFTARFGGSPVHRTGRAGLVRNACLVAANLGRSELSPVLENLQTDPDPGVADAARWAVRQLEERR
jgi:epoxyqueuosine reductase